MRTRDDHVGDNPLTWRDGTRDRETRLRDRLKKREERREKREETEERVRAERESDIIDLKEGGAANSH